jgi:hypothetical protein
MNKIIKLFLGLNLKFKHDFICAEFNHKLYTHLFNKIIMTNERVLANQN